MLILIAMSNPSKKKGTQAETKVVKYLATFGIESERIALHGSKDLGDIKIPYYSGEATVLEVKTGKQTANYSRKFLEEWKRQTITEYENSDNKVCETALVIVRYNRRIQDAEVFLPNWLWTTEPQNSGWTMMYLDEFAKQLLNYIERGFPPR